MAQSRRHAPPESWIRRGSRRREIGDGALGRLASQPLNQRAKGAFWRIALGKLGHGKCRSYSLPPLTAEFSGDSTGERPWRGATLSRHDETTVFTQRERFRLASYHLVQKGPSFPRPLEMSIDAGRGQVTVRYADDKGRPKTESESLALPPDLANGLVSTLLKNVPSEAPPPLSYVVATPKPRLVKLAVSAAAPNRFSTGQRGRSAVHYVLKVDLGGLSGLIAPLIGKQPPDAHVWVMGGDAPAFVKAEQALYVGGPIWMIELTSPVWPHPTKVTDAPVRSD